ncbi:MAG: hypothetical protein VZS44_12045, partial [Bacilli bacterium]|nr:hypothetical protein [Bacilli bacterium]
MSELNYDEAILDLIDYKLFEKCLKKYLPYIKLDSVFVTNTKLKDNKLYIDFELNGDIYGYNHTYKNNRLVYRASSNYEFSLDEGCEFDKELLQDILNKYPDGSVIEQPYPSEYETDKEYKKAYKEYKESQDAYYDCGGTTHLLSSLPNVADFIHPMLIFILQITNKLSDYIEFSTYSYSHFVINCEYPKNHKTFMYMNMDNNTINLRIETIQQKSIYTINPSIGEFKKAIRKIAHNFDDDKEL